MILYCQESDFCIVTNTSLRPIIKARDKRGFGAMKKLFIALFAVSLSLFSIPSFAIWEGVNELPTLEETYKGRDLAAEQYNRVMDSLKDSDWKKVTRESPTVFNLTIDGKSHECYYEGRDIICE